MSPIGIMVTPPDVLWFLELNLLSPPDGTQVPEFWEGWDCDFEAFFEPRTSSTFPDGSTMKSGLLLTLPPCSFKKTETGAFRFAFDVLLQRQRLFLHSAVCYEAFRRKTRLGRAFVGNHWLVVPGEHRYPHCPASSVIDQDNQFWVIIHASTWASNCIYQASEQDHWQCIH